MPRMTRRQTLACIATFAAAAIAPPLAHASRRSNTELATAASGCRT